MHYLDLTIAEIHQALKDRKVTVSELVKEALKRAHYYQDKVNLFSVIDDDALLYAQELDKHEVSDNIFFGIPVVIKDNFATKDIETTASSNILTGYKPIFDAEAVKILKEAKAVIIGKTLLDELAMGGSGTTTNKGPVKNPLDTSFLIGGSSAGSCAAVVSHITPFALGSDTGDSIRKPASFGGIVGFKPTWGRISRYGLYAFAPSLDTVGFFTYNVFDSALSFDLFNQYDKKDMTSANRQKEITHLNINKSIKGKRIAVLNDIFQSMSNKELKDKFTALMKKIEECGVVVDYININKKLYDTIYPTYMVLSCAEATSNNANLDGINFGNTQDGKNIEEVILNTRTKGFSELIKRRFILGSYVLSKENQEKLFLKAKKIRRLLVEDINRILKTYDAFILPASGGIAPKFVQNKDVDRLSDEYLLLENHMALGNFAGLPSITIPYAKYENMPIGINITGKAFEDADVLNIAYNIEQLIGGDF